MVAFTLCLTTAIRSNIMPSHETKVEKELHELKLLIGKMMEHAAYLHQETDLQIKKIHSELQSNYVAFEGYMKEIHDAVKTK